ncbi:PBECR3 domain-containing polyvalent protein, partial [Helicobacter vulpis]
KEPIAEPSARGGGKPPKGVSQDLLDPNKPLRRAKPEEITPEFLEEVKKRKDQKVWIGELTNSKIIEQLGFKTDKPIKILFDGDALKHIEKRHGKGSNLVEISKQPAVTIEDIRSYPEIVNHADLMRVVNEGQEKRLVIGKQINGYVIVIETISTKRNTLKLKTIYKANGKLENGPDFGDGAYYDYRK